MTRLVDVPLDERLVTLSEDLGLAVRLLDEARKQRVRRGYLTADTLRTLALMAERGQRDVAEARGAIFAYRWCATTGADRNARVPLPVPPTEPAP